MGSKVCEPLALTLKARAAATPLPVALAVKSPGATLTNSMLPLEAAPIEFLNEIVPGPVAVPGGIRKLICVGETNKSGASRDVFISSMTLTETPARVVGRG